MVLSTIAKLSALIILIYSLTKFSLMRKIEMKYRKSLEEYSIAIPSMNFFVVASIQVICLVSSKTPLYVHLVLSLKSE